MQELLPHENIVYLGDTARLPYGSKSPETIRQFADEDTRFLISRGVKAIVVACNTATAHALPSLREQYRVPIVGVIEPGVDAALANPQAERIGIVGKLVDESDLMNAVMETAHMMLEKSPLGLRLTKETLNQNLDAPSLEAAIELENRNQSICCFTPQFFEAVERFAKRV